MIVVFEGLEGVGKTTLAEAVAVRLCVPYIKTPPKEFNPIRSVIASGDKETNFYFYLSSLFFIQNSLAAAKGAKTHVIVDRYIHSTIAYHDRGNSLSRPDFDASKLTKADLTIHIVCEERERQRRLKARGFHLFDRPDCNESNIYQYFKRVSDFEFVNEQELTASAANLSETILKWLAENIDTLR